MRIIRDRIYSCCATIEGSKMYEILSNQMVDRLCDFFKFDKDEQGQVGGVHIQGGPQWF